jgi:hypothetical protein
LSWLVVVLDVYDETDGSELWLSPWMPNNCDRISKFYAHPLCLMNNLFFVTGAIFHLLSFMKFVICWLTDKEGPYKGITCSHHYLHQNFKARHWTCPTWQVILILQFLFLSEDQPAFFPIGFDGHLMFKVIM